MGITAMLDLLLGELVKELRDSGTEDVCAAAVYPGDAVPLDYAECGVMAWVRLVSTYPTIGFPNADLTADSCAWRLAYEVEMGVMRPSPIPEVVLSTVDLPTDAENTAAAGRQFSDMMAMHYALLGVRQDIEQLIPGTYTPTGPIGGTVGGTWSVTLGDD